MKLITSVRRRGLWNSHENFTAAETSFEAIDAIERKSVLESTTHLACRYRQFWPWQEPPIRPRSRTGRPCSSWPDDDDFECTFKRPGTDHPRSIDVMISCVFQNCSNFLSVGDFFFSGVWKSRCALVLWPNDTTLATVIDFRCRWLCTRCLIARFVLHPEQKPATINRPNNKSQNSDTCFTTAAAIKHAPHTTSTTHTVSGRMTKIPAIDPHRRRVRRHLKLSAAAAWPFKRRRLVHPPGALLSTAPALCSLHRRFFLFL